MLAFDCCFCFVFVRRVGELNGEIENKRLRLGIIQLEALYRFSFQAIRYFACSSRAASDGSLELRLCQTLGVGATLATSETRSLYL